MSIPARISCASTNGYRLAGQLIEDEELAPLLAEVLDVAEALDLGPSFFEATTAAALLAFSRTPADACILEVGLGGRLDATNIIERPAVCGISSLGIDHESFLLAPEDGTPDDPLTRIGWEKAGIAKAGVPLVVGHYPAPVNAIIADHAVSTGAPLLARKEDWDAAIYDGQIAYRDAAGTLKLPLPRMAGAHQADNAALAIAMLRHQDAIIVPEAALAAAMEWAHWPARLQLLGKGPLTDLLPEAHEVWLDGGHNADAGKALADALLRDGPITVIMGMLRNKDVTGFLKPLAPGISALYAVPITGHEHHDPKDICWQAEEGLGIASLNPVSDVEVALRHIAENGEVARVLITGSLYLAAKC